MKSFKSVSFHTFSFFLGLFIISQIILSIKLISLSLGIPGHLNFVLILFFLFSLTVFSLMINYKIDKIKNKIKIYLISIIIMFITVIIILSLYFFHKDFLETLSIIKSAVIIHIIKYFTAFIILFLSSFSVSILLIESLFYARSAGEGKISIYSLFLLGASAGIILFFLITLKHLGLFKTYLSCSFSLIILFLYFYFIIKKNKTEIFTEENNTISSQINYIVFYLKISFFIIGFGLFSIGILGYNIFNQITALSSYYKLIFLIPVLIITLLTFIIVPLLLKKFKYGYNTTFPVILSASGLTAFFIPLFFSKITGNFTPLIGEEYFIILILKLVFILTISLGPFLFFSGFLLPVNLYVVENLFGKKNKKIICFFISFFCMGAFSGIIISKFILFPLMGISMSMGIIGILLIFSAILFNSFEKGKIKFKYTLLYYAAFMLVSFFIVIASISKITYINTSNEILQQYKIISINKDMKGYETVLENNKNKILLLNNKIIINNTVNKEYDINILKNINSDKNLVIGLKTYYENELLINKITNNKLNILENSKKLQIISTIHSFSRMKNNNNKIKNYIFNDPYLFFISQNNKYDIIFHSYYWPWDNDISRLYSSNHFNNIRNSLNPDGIFLLIINNENFTQNHFNILASTMYTAFDYLYLLELSNKKIIIGQNYKNTGLQIIPKPGDNEINTTDNLKLELNSN